MGMNVCACVYVFSCVCVYVCACMYVCVCMCECTGNHQSCTLLILDLTLQMWIKEVGKQGCEGIEDKVGPSCLLCLREVVAAMPGSSSRRFFVVAVVKIYFINF